MKRHLHAASVVGMIAACALGGCGDSPVYVEPDAANADADVVPDATLDAPDAEVDALPDAGVAAFDVGYVSLWMVGAEAVSMTSDTWVRVVNMGVGDLDLSNAEISNVVTNAPGISTTVEWLPSSLQVESGRSAGALSAAAADLIVAAGHVTEPAQNTTEKLMKLSAVFPPQWTYVDIEVTLEIDGARASLPIRLSRGASGTGSAHAPQAAMRASSVPK